MSSIRIGKFLVQNPLVPMLLAALVACGALYAYTSYLQRKLDRAQVVTSLETGRAESHRTYAAEYQDTTQRREVARKDMHDALEAHPDWSSDAAPSDVANLLRHPAGAARAVPR